VTFEVRHPRSRVAEVFELGDDLLAAKIRQHPGRRHRGTPQQPGAMPAWGGYVIVRGTRDWAAFARAGRAGATLKTRFSTAQADAVTIKVAVHIGIGSLRWALLGLGADGDCGTLRQH
jgi:hypothetical protein